MSNIKKKPRKFQQLTPKDREEIAIGLEKGENYSEIARKLGVNKSTISREIKRNSPKKKKVKYRGNRAQILSDKRKYDSRQKERLKTLEIRNYVICKLMQYYSPEQIAGRMKIEHPEWKTNYESIYLFIYNEFPELTCYFRQKRKKRLKKGQAKNKRCIRVSDRTMIDERPGYIDSRKLLGHWEADTMVSRKSLSCILGVVERKSGYVQFVKLESKTALEVHRGLIERLGRLPDFLTQSLTYDNGTENAMHMKTNKVLNTKSYFCHPYSSWEKGSIENIFGLLRQYLPKGCDLYKISHEEAELTGFLQVMPQVPAYVEYRRVVK